MKGKIRRAAARLLAAVLCLGLFLPPPVRAAEVYFTSVNDNLLQLTAETMPFWSGGGLYVPYNIFDGKVTGIDLGLSCSYERNRNTAAIFNLQKILILDLSTGMCRDSQTQQAVSGRAMMRNGRIYVSLSTVCGFFDLDYSYTALSSISQGYLVRIKSSAAVLSDAKFIDAAGELLRRRLREYNQSVTASEGQTTSVPVPTPTPGNSDTSVPTYLAFRCEDGESAGAILDVLEANGAYALFLLTPRVLEEEGALVRRIVGSGHSVGVWARGEELSLVREELEQGARILEGLLHLRVTAADVPEGMSQELEAEGWVCWDETLSLSPSPETGAATFAANTLRRLSGRKADTFLTVEAGDQTARVLPALLRQLAQGEFAVSIPMETKL